MSNPLIIRGADSSHYNPPVGDWTLANFHAAKAGGVDFMWLKATEGSDKRYRDVKYAARRALCYAAHIIPGAYHFASPDPDQHDAEAEADAFFAYADPREGDLCPALDMETKNHAALEAWSKRFQDRLLTRLHERGLAPNMISTMGKQGVHYGPDDYGKDYPFLRWVPRYSNSNMRPKVPWDAWQFTDGVYGDPKAVAGLGHLDLNTLRAGVLVSDLTLTSTKKPPKPPPLPTARFRVILTPGNKTQSAQAIIEDMAKVKAAAGKGTHAVLFNTEREKPELRKAVSQGLGGGWTRVLENENTMAYTDTNFAQAVGYSDPIAMMLAKADPSKLHVQNPRWLDKMYLAHDVLPHQPVAFEGTHLVSWANNANQHDPDEAYRDWAFKTQMSDLTTEWKRLRGLSVPQVIAADFNTGVRYTGRQLEADLRKVFGADLLHVYTGGLDQIFLIGTDKVKFTASKPVVTDNRSDHNMISTTVTMTVHP